jgi:hypothetical protein
MEVAVVAGALLKRRDQSGEQPLAPLYPFAIDPGNGQLPGIELGIRVVANPNQDSGQTAEISITVIGYL